VELDEKRAAGHDEYTDAKQVDLKGVPENNNELYRMFAQKDEAWRRDQTKKLLRKVDVRLLPILVIMYLLNFLDRSSLPKHDWGVSRRILR